MVTSLTSAPSLHRSSAHAESAVVASWDEPSGVAPRGTLIVLTGRGESAAAYQRFGRRISADAYRVRVVETDLDDLDRTRDEVVAVLAADDSPAPRVLAGSDAGATLAALLAEQLDDVDAVVLAGLAVADAAGAPGDWDAELEARTVCPAHRRVLTEDPRFERGDLGRDLPAALSATVVPAVPTLVVHGSEDPLTDVGRIEQAYADTASVVRVEGGRHDVLNDVSHRSVAATVVLFLERLRLGADLPVVVRPVAP
jgi:alpha-beta hydrolase superfamily lysophospholipase